ncbi:iron-sulfur cluster assembly scaffold protein [Candidatus Laterigemmans baculatus]|uniref:iron-sulfur cluster assembly scaffold protein n=1 Tax=Candidatus Laterigemmans baculatus TaxID=2770505 RepID=UPI0013D9B2B9|nr:iron-sulfur cluster assembly scaffold protein [Candidatus Laterigemmans baculatus]
MSIDERDIYEEHVLPHYEDPYHRGHCEVATHAHEGDNPLCGDVVRVEIELDDEGRVRQAWFEGDGCTVSQSSASMLMERIEGMTVEELKQFSAEDMLALFQASLTPNRQKCCLLSWRVLQAAMHSPIDGEDEDAEVDSFGGPSLSEES